MKNLITLFFLTLVLNSFSQNITGKVFNKNKTPLAGVNIYFDGTTFSTISDENGNFTLNYDPKTKNILVISFMGYQTEYISDFYSNKELNIYLSLSVKDLKEVVIKRKDIFTRKQKLQLFRQEFLGKTPNGKASIIKNEEDIYFKYDKKNFVLKAFSDKPLIIISPSLGYEINYELENFEVTFGKLSIYSNDIILSYYKGFSRFEEINNSNEISMHRKKAYEGSQVHFFKNLTNNIWGTEQFLISNNGHLVDANNCFKIHKEEDSIKVEVIQNSEKDENEKFVASYDLLYNQKEESNVIFETNTFYVYKYGNNSNIENIIFSGRISEEKVGDMLPLNYVYIP